jgi:hypothetical protein
MMDERRDLWSLLQRLVELGVRLVNERLELAEAQLRHRAAELRRRAAPVLAGAFALAIGAALGALAAVDALAPLVPSRPLRLVLVAVPFVAVGAALLGRSSSRLAGSLADDGDDHRHQREQEQDVNPGAARVAAHHRDQPQDEQEHAQHPEHPATSSDGESATAMPRRENG